MASIGSSLWCCWSRKLDRLEHTNSSPVLADKSDTHPAPDCAPGSFPEHQALPVRPSTRPDCGISFAASVSLCHPPTVIPSNEGPRLVRAFRRGFVSSKATRPATDPIGRGVNSIPVTSAPRRRDALDVRHVDTHESWSTSRHTDRSHRRRGRRKENDRPLISGNLWSTWSRAISPTGIRITLSPLHSTDWSADDTANRAPLLATISEYLCPRPLRPERTLISLALSRVERRSEGRYVSVERIHVR